MYEVLEGLNPGDRVATSGVFLIAAEARISTAAKYWEKSPADTSGRSDREPTALPPEPAAPAPRAPPSPASPTATQALETRTATPATSSSASTSSPDSEKIYTCPMHPEVQSATPGKCPKCGMDLVLKPKGGAK